MGNERRHCLFAVRHDQNHPGPSGCGESVEDSEEIAPGFGIKAEERIVHDQHSRIIEQYLDNLEFAQLSAGEFDYLRVKERLYLEHAVEMVAHGPSLGGVRAADFISLFQKLPDRRHVRIDSIGIPPLLEEILGIGCAVRIPECQVFDIVADKRFLGRREIVCRDRPIHRMGHSNHFCQECLASAVRTDDSYMFILI